MEGEDVMKQKTNTSRIAGWIFEYDLLKGLVIGAAIALVLALISIPAALFVWLSALMVLLGLIVITAVGIAGIVGLIRGRKFRETVEKQEKGSSFPFDSEVFRPITSEGSVLLSDHWMLLKKRGAMIPLERSHITGVDPVNTRHEGMKKLWIRVSTDNKTSHVINYAACEPDALETAASWLKETASGPVSGICPYCGGPNQPGTEICQWCGSSLRKESENIHA